MSARHRKSRAQSLRRSAPVFAALGDSTRLRILASLAAGRSLSIARLTEGSALSRQAITKHLGVLEHAGLVRGVRRGRENRFELEPEPLAQARRALDAVSRRWDEALARLRALVEE